MKVKIQEAYVNEYKGNLLEFLIGQQLAVHFQQESDFFRSISASFFQQLVTYEQQLRELNPQLAQILPAYAQQLAKILIAHFPWERPRIRLVGKLATNHELQEADLLIQENSQIYPLSIKFSKHHAYINTKSGGIKSFVGKYFACFPSAKELQQELNEHISTAFWQMGNQMYQLAGRSFLGKFDASWPWQLPGELPTTHHEILTAYYQQVIVKIYEVFQGFWAEGPEAFARCLQKLIGHSDHQIYHLFAFHPNHYQDLAGAEFLLLGPEFYH